MNGIPNEQDGIRIVVLWIVQWRMDGEQWPMRLAGDSLGGDTVLMGWISFDVDGTSDKPTGQGLHEISDHFSTRARIGSNPYWLMS